MSRELLYQRHSALVATYQRYSSDRDVLAEHHEFVRDDEADRAAAPASYGVRMAIKYFRRLFKEYALADLSRFERGQIGLRWRTEREVVEGKGQFVCGGTACAARDALRSFEVDFKYVERGARKRELVKPVSYTHLTLPTKA